MNDLSKIESWIGDQEKPGVFDLKINLSEYRFMYRRNDWYFGLERSVTLPDLLFLQLNAV